LIKQPADLPNPFPAGYVRLADLNHVGFVARPFGLVHAVIGKRTGSGRFGKTLVLVWG